MSAQLQFPSMAWSRAQFTLDRTHRWWLHRVWDCTKGEVLFVMLNPSQAGEEENDPTIRRCIGFAHRWGYGSIRVMNLFSLVCTDPDAMYKNPGDLGPLYETRMMLASKEAALTVVAWGALRPQPRVIERRDAVMALLKDPVCLGRTKGGDPKHPLYVPYTAELKP